jgi:hypothetical protein
MTDDRPCIVTPCGGAAPRGAPVRAKTARHAVPPSACGRAGGAAATKPSSAVFDRFPRLPRTDIHRGDDPPNPPRGPTSGRPPRRRPSSRRSCSPCSYRRSLLGVSRRPEAHPPASVATAARGPAHGPANSHHGPPLGPRPAPARLPSDHSSECGHLSPTSIGSTEPICTQRHSWGFLMSAMLHCLHKSVGDATLPTRPLMVSAAGPRSYPGPLPTHEEPPLAPPGPSEPGATNPHPAGLLS